MKRIETKFEIPAPDSEGSIEFIDFTLTYRYKDERGEYINRLIPFWNLRPSEPVTTPMDEPCEFAITVRLLP